MTLHHWFIPNKKNNFHPFALRPIGLMVFLAVFITVPFLYNVTSAKQAQVLGYATSISVSDINVLSNQERINNGLPALNIDNRLTSAAQAKAADMFADNYWAHVAPDGVTPWSFIYGAGYNYSAAGENLAKDFNTSAGVVNGWMNSATHRANVLNSTYQDVGYAAVNGVLLGSETTLVVAMYGQRVAPAAAPTPTPVSPQVSTPTSSTNTSATPTPLVEDTTPAPAETSPAEAPAVSSPTTTLAPTEKTQNVTETAITKASSNDLNGLVEGIATSAPVRAYTSLNWGQKVSILLVCALMLLFIMKHTLVWRAQRKGVRNIWLRAHPIGQLTVIAMVAIVTITSGVGVVL